MKFTFTEEFDSSNNTMIRFEVEDDFNEIYVTFHVTPDEMREVIKNMQNVLGESDV